MGQQIDLTQQVQGVLPEANGGAGPNSGLRFADAETPSGTINGSNQTFTLANPPNPALSVLLFLAKALQIQGTDYTLSANTISMIAAPSGSPSFLAWYRYRLFSFAQNFTDTLAIVDSFLFDLPVAAFPGDYFDQLPMIDYMSLQMPPNLFGDSMAMSDALSDMEVGVDSVTLTDSLLLTDAFSSFLASNFLALTQTVSDVQAVTDRNDSLAYLLTPGAAYFTERMWPADSVSLIARFFLSDNLLVTEILDPFTSTLSGSWTALASSGSFAYDGTTGLKINVSGTGNLTLMKRNDVVYGTAQHAEVKVAALNSGAMNIGPAINLQASLVEGYMFVIFGGNYTIYRIDAAGSPTLIASVGSATVSVGDVLRLENDGSGHLAAKKNGAVVASATSTFYLNGTIGVGAIGSTNPSRAINFEGGPTVNNVISSGLADAFASSLV